MSTKITQPDAKIFGAGVFHVHCAFQKYFIIRYNTDGSIDLGFGTKGMVVNEFAQRPSLNSLILQPDGKILGQGTIYGADADYSKSFLVRYNSDGTIDAAFGNRGFIINDASSISSFSRQSDGKIVVTSDSIPYSLAEHNLVRYTGIVHFELVFVF